MQPLGTVLKLVGILCIQVAANEKIAENTQADSSPSKKL